MHYLQLPVNVRNMYFSFSFTVKRQILKIRSVAFTKYLKENTMDIAASVLTNIAKEERNVLETSHINGK